MDDVDRVLLAALQENADMPAKRLAERVALSTSAVERRIARLKQDGVIEKIVAVVDPKAIGRPLSILVELEIQNEHRHTLDQFQRWLDRAPEIQSCWYVTGDMDYVLLVAVRDLAEYNAFIERLMTEQQALVRKYKSIIALKTIKHGLALSVEA
ncbi:transcriptional regulator [Rhizobium sp. Leaf371]|uniref:Lrp/AsnC family transcriptional regulator n=1 Tax=unclassified Rhizobium TaxID=2613769 RepID=UPI0007124325|nr:Lrp/AsnC family transcriptional regulator [Rhizobium sp. PP-F2F-G48]KQS68133.1 transcriptional regulator [Rhizobium sp. Leaf371]TCM55708.1 AsnC family transcriptional regulator [Rhizobium sp. PP-F2F-G48]